MSRQARSSLGSVPTRVQAVLWRAWYDVDLLLGRRIWLLLLVDGMLILSGIQTAVDADGDQQAWVLYRQTVLIPAFVLMLPALSAVLALERRAGSLELALSSVSVTRYVARRVWPLPVFFIVQSLLVIPFLPHPRRAWLLLVALHAIAVILSLVAVVVFWIVRIETAGGVLVAALASSIALSTFVFRSPFPPRTVLTFDRLRLPLLENVSTHLVETLWGIVVLLATSLVLLIAARWRLRRPHRLAGHH